MRSLLVALTFTAGLAIVAADDRHDGTGLSPDLPSGLTPDTEPAISSAQSSISSTANGAVGTSAIGHLRGGVGRV